MRKSQTAKENEKAGSTCGAHRTPTRQVHQGVARPKAIVTSEIRPIPEHVVERFSSVGGRAQKLAERVTLILPTKDRSSGLEATLESLPAAMGSIDHEIILYADRSSAAIDRCIQKYGIQKVFYDREVFGDSNSFSWSKLMNHGFSQASGEWVMYGSDDILLHPDCVRQALSLCSKQKDRSIGGISFLHRNTVETYEGFFADFGYDTLNGDKLYINFGIISTEAFKKTDGFDENLRFFWADVDICAQLWDRGYEVIPSPDSLVDHLNYLEMEQKEKRVALFQRDTAYFYTKWEPSSLFGGRNPLEKIRYIIHQTGVEDTVAVHPLDGEAKTSSPKQAPIKVVVDGVIFQLQAINTHGISRVWKNLIAQLALIPELEITVLQRQGFDIPVKGVRGLTVPPLQLTNEEKLDEDDEMLARVCRELGADLFVSTYSTRAPGVVNLVMVHDLIPEKFGFDTSGPEWFAKKRVLETADSYICVSRTTQKDLVTYYPQVANRPIAVAYHGCEAHFKRRNQHDVKKLCQKLNLKRPYVMLVGNRHGYKNGLGALQALARLSDEEKPTVLCVGGERARLSAENDLMYKLDIRYAGRLREEDLVLAYNGALALLVPSRYEGFGLSVVEAMACRCPVIAYPSPAVSEIGADAICYADLNSTAELRRALIRVQETTWKRQHIPKGVQRAETFDWSSTSQVVSGFMQSMMARTSVLLTAIVSTYNAAMFIHGCLDDLVGQTIADRLEIIVIDSGSELDEVSYVRKFQKNHPNIKYLRTAGRESVYRAWNRGIKFALGKYITNANTDDRHRRDAFEKMTGVLEARNEIALVYADVLKTETANETFDACTPTGVYRWHDWRRQTLLDQGCFIGPQPVWRKSVHHEYGYFDENYQVSSDFEFWLRISQTNQFHHIPEPLGLYLDRPDSIEHANDALKHQEDLQIMQDYRRAEDLKKLIRRRPEEKGFGSSSNSRTAPEKTRSDVHSFENIKIKDEATNQGGCFMNSPETIFRAVEHLIDGDHIEAADWVLGKLLVEFPDNAQIHNATGALAYQRDHMSKALEHFRQAALLEPRNLLYLKNLGDFLYSVEKDAAAALAHYEKALAIDPDHVDSLIMAGHVSISQHRYTDARNYYQRVRDLDPQNLEVQKFLEKLEHSKPDGASSESVDKQYEDAQTKFAQGDAAGALSMLEQLLAQDDGHAPAHNDLGVLNYENGNMDKARFHYESAAALMPEGSIFQKNLADFYWAVLEDHQLAMEKYVQVLKLNPQDIEAQLSCGQICMALEKHADARDFFETVLQIEPWNENAQQLLEQLDQMVAGDVPKTDIAGFNEQVQLDGADNESLGTINDLRHLLIDQPDNASAHNDLGVLYYDVGDKTNALQHYEQAVRLDPACHTYLKNLADFILVEQGRAEDAMRLYLQVLEENPADIESLTAIGMVCVSLGKAEDAQHFYQRVLEIEPGNPTALNALEDLNNVLIQRGVTAAAG